MKIELRKKEYSYNNWLSEFGGISDRGKISPKKRAEADQVLIWAIDKDLPSFKRAQDLSEEDPYSTFYFPRSDDARYWVYSYDNESDDNRKKYRWLVGSENFDEWLGRLSDGLADPAAYDEYLDCNEYNPSLASFSEEEQKVLAYDHVLERVDHENYLDSRMGFGTIRRYAREQEIFSRYYSGRGDVPGYLKWAKSVYAAEVDEAPSPEFFKVENYETLAEAQKAFGEKKTEYEERAEAFALEDRDIYKRYLEYVEYSPATLFGENYI